MGYKHITKTNIMSNTYKVIIAAVTIGILGVTSIFLVGQSREQNKAISAQSSSAVSSAKSQLVSGLVQSRMLSSVVSSTAVQISSVAKTESQLIPNTIPTFDSRNQTSLKLTTQNQITSISVGECKLETKFRIGTCEIVDQDKNTLLKLNVVGGNPLILDSTNKSQKLINLVRGYGLCSFIEYELNFANKEFSINRNLSSPGCQDKSVILEIEKYSDLYNKLNN